MELIDLPAEIQNFAASSDGGDRRGSMHLVSTIDSGAVPQWTDDDPAAERRLLIEALQACHGNKTKAAIRLGLPRSTYFSKLKKFGITDNERNEPPRYGRLPR